MKRTSPEAEITKFRSYTMQTEHMCKNMGTKRLLQSAKKVDPPSSQSSIESIVDAVGRPTIAVPTSLSSPFSCGPHGKKMRVLPTPSCGPAARPSRIGKPALLRSPSRTESPQFMSARLSPSVVGEARENDNVASSDCFGEIDIRTPPFGSEQEMKSSSCNWAVPKEALPAVPLYYPISPTSCLVEGADAGIVSRRISDCLRDNSIAAFYVNETATARATTQDHVAFTIRLFSSQSQEQNDIDAVSTCTISKQGVLVEIQHGHGSPITFHRGCRMIFNAAKGMPSKMSPPPSPRSRSCLRTGLSPPPSPTIKPSPPLSAQPGEPQEKMVLAMEKALELLHKDRMDANKLGMELLVFLTDATQVCEKDALLASRVILFGEKEGRSSCLALHEKVMGCVVQDGDDVHEDGMHGEGRVPDAADGESCSMRSIGLTVLRNALRNLAHPNTSGSRNEGQNQPLSVWFVEGIANSLLAALKEANYQPHEACLAASCITSMMKLCHHHVHDSVSSHSGSFVAALEGAHRHGLSAHAMLARESQRALSELRTHAASVAVSCA